MTARVKSLVLALSATMVLSSTSYAATLGHSRIMSASGEPLRIQVPIKQLSAGEAQSLQVQAAPAEAWRSAGLTPPVQLETLGFHVAPGLNTQSRLIQISSPQGFDGQVADLLLRVRTASGEQLHQVSILARAGKAAAGPGFQSAQTGASSGAASGSSMAVPGATASSVRVQRGDTLFRIARANAVEGVTVYQMMVALLRANPQAFIDGNLNLVKAGATLDIPGAGQLAAVSDAEARRIFRQHTLDFHARRQSASGGQGVQTAVAGTQPDEGVVSRAARTESTTAPAAPRDQVVLTSGGAAEDTAADDRAATSQNIQESGQRVSQLEQNVKSLNKALQSQGEAAKDAVLDGATAVSESIASLANTIAGDQGTTTAGTMATNGTPASSAAASGAAAAPGTANSAATARAAGSNVSAQPGGVAQQAGGTGGQADAGAQPSAQPSDAAGRQAGGATSGQEPSGAARGEALAEGTASGENQAAGQSTTDPASTSSNKAEQTVSWFQEHILAVVTAILALIVLIIAWVLRRANAGRHDSDQGVPITEAMVKEQLEKINLDLGAPPTDERPANKS